MDVLAQLPSEDEGDMAVYLALAAKVKAALKAAVEIRVPVEKIYPYVGQPREYFDPAKLKMLSDSIDAGGQTTPGLIRKKPKGKKDEFELIDGERRQKAILMIPPERRPLYEARLIEAPDDVVQFILSGIANFNREGHTPIEAMKTIDRLHQLKIPMSEIAKLLGVSLSWAGQIYGLRNLAPEIQAKLSPELSRKEQIPLVAAVRISKIPSWPHQRLIAKDVQDGKLQLADIRNEVIKTASKAGIQIRLREIAPHKQWESLHSKVGVLVRTGAEMRTMLEKQDFQEHVAGRGSETRKLIRDLESATRVIAWAADRVKKCVGM